MKVELLDYSPDAVANIVTAARGCFASKKKGKYEDDINLCKALIKNDHSPVEFAWAMFKISGISRACANQINRYRHTSQAQESMRYVDASGKAFIYPYTCISIAESCQDVVDTCFKFYNRLIKAGVPKEDARYFLPLGTETQLIIALNFRELRHILKQRLDKSSQWEVRKVSMEIYNICQDKWPWLVDDLEGEK